MAIGRVLRSIRQAIPTGVVLGRTDPGDGPVQFIPLSDALSSQLDAISSTRGSILYRGASGWAALPPGTVDDVLTTKGAGADPVWQTAAGGGGAWWFSPPTTTSLPTQVTDGTVTNIVVANDSDVGLQIAATLGAAENSIIRVAASPSLSPSGFSVRCKMWGNMRGISGTAGHFANAGVVMRDSSTGRRTLWGYSGVGLLAARSINGTTGIADNYISPNPLTGEALEGMWFRMDVDSSGNLTGYFSPDGKQWIQAWTATAANSAGAGIDQVGVGFGSRAGGWDGVMTVPFYEVV